LPWKTIRSRVAVRVVHAWIKNRRERDGDWLLLGAGAALPAEGRAVGFCYRWTSRRTKLPSHSPSMKIVTMTVTDSMFTP
jgi:hypothetical protein